MATVTLVCVLLTILTGCTSGIPKVPDDPEEALAKADRYFERKKYYQSQQLYQGFLERHAGHGRSDYAQFMLGESYFGEESYALAVVEYQILVTNYGYSDYVDDAFYRHGLALMKQSPRTALDQSVCLDAKSKFEQFVQVFSNSELMPDVVTALAGVNLKLAKKDFETAMFYFRGKRYQSCMIYLDGIIETYPDNEYWYRCHFYRGMILRARGDDEGAMRAFSTLLSSEANYKESKDGRRYLESLREGGE